MDMKAAIYILRMVATFQSNIFWAESNEVDFEEKDRLTDRYEELKWDMGFGEAADIARAEFILRIVENGIPAGAGAPEVPEIRKRQRVK